MFTTMILYSEKKKKFAFHHFKIQHFAEMQISFQTNAHK